MGNDPLYEVTNLDGVEAAYVFAPPAELVAKREGDIPPQEFSAKELRDFIRYLFDNGGVSEVLICYPQKVFFLKVMDDRALVIMGSSRANPALLRVGVEVLEHRWREDGLDKVFPKRGKRSPFRFWRSRKEG